MVQYVVRLSFVCRLPVTLSCG